MFKSDERELEALHHNQQTDRKLVPLGENECFFCGINLAATNYFDADIELATKASEEQYAREHAQEFAAANNLPPPPTDVPESINENQGGVIRTPGNHGPETMNF